MDLQLGECGFFFRIISEKVVKEQSDSEAKISFIELPNIKGQNDVLTRNFFTIETEDLDGKEKKDVIPANGLKGAAKRIEEKLRLANS